MASKFCLINFVCAIFVISITIPLISIALNKWTLSRDDLSLREEAASLRKLYGKLLLDYETLKQEKGGFSHGGCECEATSTELAKYMNYTVMAPCPDDWYLVQDLIFKKNCYSLPNRRCLARTPQKLEEPLGLPDCLFDQKALKNGFLRWDLHMCKTYECLNSRILGDCRTCFNLSWGHDRWLRFTFPGSITIPQLLAMKDGRIRTGIDVGGGSGTFAAQMAKRSVTIVTTAMNGEGIPNSGLPYMETIAARGLIPLHLPHKARLPFFDNTLDLVHSCNSIKYFSFSDFELLVIEWDRVLRVGGIIWMDAFYAPVNDMPQYISMLLSLKYKRLYWNEALKDQPSERRDVPHMYLNAVLEKQVRLD